MGGHRSRHEVGSMIIHSFILHRTILLIMYSVTGGPYPVPGDLGHKVESLKGSAQKLVSNGGGQGGDVGLRGQRLLHAPYNGFSHYLCQPTPLSSPWLWPQAEVRRDSCWLGGFPCRDLGLNHPVQQPLFFGARIAKVASRPTIQFLPLKSLGYVTSPNSRAFAF